MSSGVAPGEDPAVHRRVQRHDTVTEQLVEARQGADRSHGDVLVGESAGRCRRSRASSTPSPASSRANAAMPVLS